MALNGIMAAIGIGSAIGNSAGQIYANANSWKKTKWAMQMQQDFQERMSNTAYQRATADMKAAGLNPMMMFGGSGGAASSPSGGQANIPVENPISAGLATAMDAKRLSNETKVSKAQKENLEADSYLKGNQANTEAERFANEIKTGKYIESQTAKNLSDISNNRMMTLQNMLESQTRMDLNSAQAWRAKHQALGFSSSSSNSTNYSGNLGYKGAGLGGNYSGSHSSSRTW